MNYLIQILILISSKKYFSYIFSYDLFAVTHFKLYTVKPLIWFDCSKLYLINIWSISNIWSHLIVLYLRFYFLYT